MSTVELLSEMNRVREDIEQLEAEATSLQEQADNPFATLPERIEANHRLQTVERMLTDSQQRLKQLAQEQKQSLAAARRDKAERRLDELRGEMKCLNDRMREVAEQALPHLVTAAREALEVRKGQEAILNEYRQCEGELDQQPSFMPLGDFTQLIPSGNAHPNNPEGWPHIIWFLWLLMNDLGGNRSAGIASLSGPIWPVLAAQQPGKTAATALRRKGLLDDLHAD